MQQRLVFSRQHLQMRLDEIGVLQRGPENLDASPMRRRNSSNSLMDPKMILRLDFVDLVDFVPNLI